RARAVAVPPRRSAVHARISCAPLAPSPIVTGRARRRARIRRSGQHHREAHRACLPPWRSSPGRPARPADVLHRRRALRRLLRRRVADLGAGGRRRGQPVGGEAGLLRLVCDEPPLLAEVRRAPPVAELLCGAAGDREALLVAPARGPLKQALIALGWPVEDLAPYEDGAELAVALDDELVLRDYQTAAAEAFAASGAGVVVLPCGSGKTIVGLAPIAAQRAETLIVTSNAASVQQWRRELTAPTTLPPEALGEYSGQRKELRPV